MTTATENKAGLPNGTPLASLIPSRLKVRTVDTTALPSRSIGKERTPGQFDDLVGKAKESGEGKLIELPADASEDVRKAVVSELHRSAAFHDIGLDVWRSLDDGIAFVCRPKRVRKAKP